MSANAPAGPNPVLVNAINRVATRHDLGGDEAAEVLDQIMLGAASPEEVAGFLVGLRTKGETAAEIAGLVRTMRAHATPVNAQRTDLVDTAGTGGGDPTFNVSTTAAFVAAGAGCAVAKHGNRSNTSLCGSADLLEALGANIELAPGAVATLIDEIGFGFMFAPIYHSAMRFVVPVRKALGVHTVFNFLGPLTNPAGATRQLIGVADASLLDTIAHTLAQLGVEHALVVNGEGRYDEISASGTSRVFEVRGDVVTEMQIAPNDLGLTAVDCTALTAGTPEQNAQLTREVLAGREGAERALVLANAAAAIYVGGKAASLLEGAGLAAQAIDSGAATATLDNFVERSNELRGAA
ncbi:MAG: anthranilate phosphoribosyltransferase [Thermoleophilaceae bacterium]|nr:anthranilate phosphoribosyltransferase [Thermoleophilaceae bacterium]